MDINRWSRPLRSQPLGRHLFKLHGVTVEESGSFRERLTGKVWVKSLNADWWMYPDGFQPSRVYLWHKRLLDIVCATLMILITAPLMLLIAFGIKMDSPGPVIFKQERTGLYGVKFTLYKFRSMKEDAEARTGPRWAAEFDDRVTPFGRLLRKFRLDEIPQACSRVSGSR